jgi:salicylate hydroxylase
VALRAVVVGGGIGGIAAAVALGRAGIDVQVHEQAQQLTQVGAGVSTSGPKPSRSSDRRDQGPAREFPGRERCASSATLS